MSSVSSNFTLRVRDTRHTRPRRAATVEPVALDEWRNKVICADALALAKSMPSGSVNCIVTSPPYFGLRNYGVDGQIGLEQSPEAYIKRLVLLFRELRRVLRDDGTLFLNLGDSYVSDSKGTGGDNNKGNQGSRYSPVKFRLGLPPKNLIGIPWRVALTLQADGWILRSDIIWHKPAPMPESVTDRPTKAHEYVFLLAKSGRYYYDADAIKEPAINGDPTSPRGSKGVNGQKNAGLRKQDTPGKATYTGFNARWDSREEPLTHRNKRSVWTVNPQPFPDAHFATFPPKLIEPMILAGSPPGGVVYDPFMGSGTTALVARRLGRDYAGSELNPEYVEMARKRLAQGFTPDMFETLAKEKSA